MEISHVIAELREKNKISQRELARNINVSAGIVGSWETGRSNPGYENCIALADYFKISMNELFAKDRSINSFDYHENDLSKDEKKIIDIYMRLDEDNKDILIGKGKELLKEQRLEEKREVKQLATKRA